MTVELTILLPCRDEAETIGVCIEKARGFLKRSGIVGELLVADNGSRDGSQAIARGLGARVIHIERRGYGAALLGGIEAARGRFVVMADADDSYDVSLVDPFVERLRAGADLVMGNRFAGGILPGAMPPLHQYFGNPVLSRLGRLLSGSAVHDFHCGLRGFRREAILALGLRTTGMEFASEMVVKAHLHGLATDEVPIVLHPDGRSRPPHLRSWRDGWRHLRFLLVYSPKWLFLYPGLVATLLGGALCLALLDGRLAVGPVHLGPGAHLLAAVATILGYQTLLFGVLAKVHGQLAGYVPDDPSITRLFRHVRLETGLLAGAGLVVIGTILGGVAFVRWRNAGWGSEEIPDDLSLVVPAALGLVLGAQTVLASFFLSVLGIPHLGAPPSPLGDAGRDL